MLFLWVVSALGLVLIVSADSEEEQGDQYLGVPLGALHLSADGTSAEVYAADEFTVVFNHFYHNPISPGCTSMMIGPPRSDDTENLVDGHGVLLPVLQGASAKKFKRRRLRRRVPMAFSGNSYQFQGWPLEFDHLLVGGPVAVSNDTKKDSENSPVPSKPRFRGMNVEPKSLLSHAKAMNDSKNATQKVSVSIEAPQNNKVDASNHSTVSSFTQQFSTISPVFRAITPNTEKERTSADISNVTSSYSISTPTNKPQKGHHHHRKTHRRTTSTITTLQTPAESTTITDSTTEASSKKLITESTTEMPNIANKIPSTIHPKDQINAKERTENVSKETYTMSSQSSEKLEQKSRTSFQKSRETSAKELRRAPSRTPSANMNNAKFLGENDIEDISGQKDQFSGFFGQPTTQKPAQIFIKNSSFSPAPGAKTTTPLFWVIKDPREARRQRLLTLRKRLESPENETLTTTTTKAPFVPFDKQFELPKIRDKLVTFTLTNGAKITQYKWIGLYNQCTNRHIPLVSLRDVDPPREEKIMPLSGWSHNVTSYRLHILNCNTILVPSFHYDGRNSTRNTYFFAGIGQFPDVERQLKVIVVGSKPGEALRDYRGEDVLLRLPKTFRTFDVDFISLYNTDEKKSFAHVLIPSLLVPPCAEDDL